MNDPEFLELLNLYLDHEISPADAAKLEAEVQRSPARRDIYQEYCRMQKACSMLASDFVEQTTAGDTRNISGFIPDRPRWWSSSYAAAGLVTMAACVAFLLVTRRAEPVRAQSGGVAPGQVIAADRLQGAAVAVSTPLHAVTMPARRSDFQPVIAPYSGRDPSSTPGDVAADSRLNWLKNVQLVSLPAPDSDPLRFDNKALPANNTTPRTFGPLQGPTESNALQFQR